MRHKLPYLRVLAALTLLAAAGCSDDPDTPEKPGPGPDPDPIEKPTPTLTIEAGPCTNNSVDVLLSAQDADEMAYLALAPEDAEHVPDAAGIFQVGATVPSTTEPKPFTVPNLRAGTEYTVWAAARAEDRYSEPKSVVLHTSEQPPMLSFVSSSKTGFSYRIDHIASDQTVIHTYVEKWAYDDMWNMYAAAYGENFDINIMLCNILAEYGYEAVGPQTIEWHAGDENIRREGPATIVGGKPYYAIASLADPVSGEWIGDPESVTFDTEPAGKSSATIDIRVDDVTSEFLFSTITPDPTIRFYFYHLFPKADVDDFVAKNGQEAFENYIYEHGYCDDGPYSDQWRFSVPGDVYLLAVFGIDENGDTMYTDRVVDSPEFVPDILVSMQPYESELQGNMTYNSLEVTVALDHFDDIPLESMQWQWAFVPAETIDAFESQGMTLEDAIMQGYLMTYQFAVEWSEALEKDGFFIATFADLPPSTEYGFVVLTMDSSDELMVRYARASTDAEPAVTQPDAEYLAYLGTWTLSGTSTEDYYAPMEYNLTVEQLTPNRSFLVKGWSKSSIGIDYPFVMNYDPETKKFFIRSPQTLGTFNEDGIDYEVCFTGMITDERSDDLKPIYGSSRIAYTGSIDGDRMRFFSALFDYEGRTHDFAALGYTGRDAEGAVHRFAGDQYNSINFYVNRAAAAQSMRPAASVGRRIAAPSWLLPAPQVRIPLRGEPQLSAPSPMTERRLRCKELNRESTASDRMTGSLRPIPHVAR